jgi:hypothetical protein
MRVAQETGADPVEAARAFYHVSGALHVPWLRNGDLRRARRTTAGSSAPPRRWSRTWPGAPPAGRAGDEEPRSARSVDQAAETVMRARASEMGRFQALLQEIQSEPSMTLSGLSVAVREIALLSDRLNGGRALKTVVPQGRGESAASLGRRGP